MSTNWTAAATASATSNTPVSLWDNRDILNMLQEDWDALKSLPGDIRRGVEAHMDATKLCSRLFEHTQDGGGKGGKAGGGSVSTATAGAAAKDSKGSNNKDEFLDALSALLSLNRKQAQDLFDTYFEYLNSRGKKEKEDIENMSKDGQWGPLWSLDFLSKICTYFYDQHNYTWRIVQELVLIYNNTEHPFIESATKTLAQLKKLLPKKLLSYIKELYTWQRQSLRIDTFKTFPSAQDPVSMSKFIMQQDKDWSDFLAVELDNALDCLIDLIALNFVEDLGSTLVDIFAIAESCGFSAPERASRDFDNDIRLKYIIIFVRSLDFRAFGIGRNLSIHKAQGDDDMKMGEADEVLNAHPLFQNTESSHKALKSMSDFFANKPEQHMQTQQPRDESVLPVLSLVWGLFVEVYKNFPSRKLASSSSFLPGDCGPHHTMTAIEQEGSLLSLRFIIESGMSYLTTEDPRCILYCETLQDVANALLYSRQLDKRMGHWLDENMLTVLASIVQNIYRNNEQLCSLFWDHWARSDSSSSSSSSASNASAWPLCTFIKSLSHQANEHNLLFLFLNGIISPSLQCQQEMIRFLFTQSVFKQSVMDISKLSPAPGFPPQGKWVIFEKPYSLHPQSLPSIGKDCSATSFFANYLRKYDDMVVCTPSSTQWVGVKERESGRQCLVTWQEECTWWEILLAKVVSVPRSLYASLSSYQQQQLLMEESRAMGTSISDANETLLAHQTACKFLTTLLTLSPTSFESNMKVGLYYVLEHILFVAFLVSQNVPPNETVQEIVKKFKTLQGFQNCIESNEKQVEKFLGMGGGGVGGVAAWDHQTSGQEEGTVGLPPDVCKNLIARAKVSGPCTHAAVRAFTDTIISLLHAAILQEEKDTQHFPKVEVLMKLTAALVEMPCPWPAAVTSSLSRQFGGGDGVGFGADLQFPSVVMKILRRYQYGSLQPKLAVSHSSGLVGQSRDQPLLSILLPSLRIFQRILDTVNSPGTCLTLQSFYDLLDTDGDHKVKFGTLQQGILHHFNVSIPLETIRDSVNAVNGNRGYVEYGDLLYIVHHACRDGIPQPTFSSSSFTSAVSSTSGQLAFINVLQSLAFTADGLGGQLTCSIVKHTVDIFLSLDVSLVQNRDDRWNVACACMDIFMSALRQVPVTGTPTSPSPSSSSSSLPPPPQTSSSEIHQNQLSGEAAGTYFLTCLAQDVRLVRKILQSSMVLGLTALLRSSSSTFTAGAMKRVRDVVLPMDFEQSLSGTSDQKVLMATLRLSEKALTLIDELLSMHISLDRLNGFPRAFSTSSTSTPSAMSATSASFPSTLAASATFHGSSSSSSSLSMQFIATAVSNAISVLASSTEGDNVYLARSGHSFSSKPLYCTYATVLFGMLRMEVSTPSPQPRLVEKLVARVIKNLITLMTPTTASTPSSSSSPHSPLFGLSPHNPTTKRQPSFMDIVGTDNICSLLPHLFLSSLQGHSDCNALELVLAMVSAQPTALALLLQVQDTSVAKDGGKKGGSSEAPTTEKPTEKPQMTSFVLGQPSPSAESPTKTSSSSSSSNSALLPPPPPPFSPAKSVIVHALQSLLSRGPQLYSDPRASNPYLLSLSLTLTSMLFRCAADSPIIKKCVMELLKDSKFWSNLFAILEEDLEEWNITGSDRDNNNNNTNNNNKNNVPASSAVQDNTDVVTRTASYCYKVQCHAAVLDLLCIEQYDRRNHVIFSPLQPPPNASSSTGTSVASSEHKKVDALIEKAYESNRFAAWFKQYMSVQCDVVYSGVSHWTLATITSLRRTNTSWECDVKYKDGEIECGVNISRLQPASSEIHKGRQSYTGAGNALDLSTLSPGDKVACLRPSLMDELQDLSHRLGVDLKSLFLRSGLYPLFQCAADGAAFMGGKNSPDETVGRDGGVHLRRYDLLMRSYLSQISQQAESVMQGNHLRRIVAHENTRVVSGSKDMIDLLSEDWGRIVDISYLVSAMLSISDAKLSLLSKWSLFLQLLVIPKDGWDRDDISRSGTLASTPPSTPLHGSYGTHGTASPSMTASSPHLAPLSPSAQSGTMSPSPLTRDSSFVGDNKSHFSIQSLIDYFRRFPHSMIRMAKSSTATAAGGVPTGTNEEGGESMTSLAKRAGRIGAVGAKAIALKSELLVTMLHHQLFDVSLMAQDTRYSIVALRDIIGPSVRTLQTWAKVISKFLEWYFKSDGVTRGFLSGETIGDSSSLSFSKLPSAPAGGFGVMDDGGSCYRSCNSDESLRMYLLTCLLLILRAIPSAIETHAKRRSAAVEDISDWPSVQWGIFYLALHVLNEEIKNAPLSSKPTSSSTSSSSSFMFSYPHTSYPAATAASTQTGFSMSEYSQTISQTCLLLMKAALPPFSLSFVSSSSSSSSSSTPWPTQQALCDQLVSFAMTFASVTSFLPSLLHNYDIWKVSTAVGDTEGSIFATPSMSGGFLNNPRMQQFGMSANTSSTIPPSIPPSSSTASFASNDSLTLRDYQDMIDDAKPALTCCTLLFLILDLFAHGVSTHALSTECLIKSGIQQLLCRCPLLLNLQSIIDMQVTKESQKRGGFSNKKIAPLLAYTTLLGSSSVVTDCWTKSMDVLGALIEAVSPSSVTETPPMFSSYLTPPPPNSSSSLFSQVFDIVCDFMSTFSSLILAPFPTPRTRLSKRQLTLIIDTVSLVLRVEKKMKGWKSVGTIAGRRLMDTITDRVLSTLAIFSKILYISQTDRVKDPPPTTTTTSLSSSSTAAPPPTSSEVCIKGQYFLAINDTEKASLNRLQLEDRLRRQQRRRKHKMRRSDPTSAHTPSNNIPPTLPSSSSSSSSSSSIDTFTDTMEKGLEECVCGLLSFLVHVMSTPYGGYEKPIVEIGSRVYIQVFTEDYYYNIAEGIITNIRTLTPNDPPLYVPRVEGWLSGVEADVEYYQSRSRTLYGVTLRDGPFVEVTKESIVFNNPPLIGFLNTMHLAAELGDEKEPLYDDSSDADIDIDTETGEGGGALVEWRRGRSERYGDAMSSGGGADVTGGDIDDMVGVFRSRRHHHRSGFDSSHYMDSRRDGGMIVESTMGGMGGGGLGGREVEGGEGLGESFIRLCTTAHLLKLVERCTEAGVRMRENSNTISGLASYLLLTTLAHHLKAVTNAHDLDDRMEQLLDLERSLGVKKHCSINTSTNVTSIAHISTITNTSTSSSSSSSSSYQTKHSRELVGNEAEIVWGKEWGRSWEVYVQSFVCPTITRLQEMYKWNPDEKYRMERREEARE